MAAHPIPAVKVHALHIQALDADGSPVVVEDWVVRRFELVERLSEPYSLNLSLSTARSEMHVAGLVGQRCWLRFGRGEFVRDVQGVVFKAETVGFVDGRLCIRLWVVPALEVLRLSKRSRVFSGETALGIVAQLLQPVFADYEGSMDATAIDDYDLRVRDCCVQYDETDLEFLQRILAEEAIVFSFRHRTENAEELVLKPRTATFHSAADEDDAAPLLIALCPRDPELAGEESIQNLDSAARMRPNQMEVATWDWRANPPAHVAGRRDPLVADNNLDPSKARFGEVYTFEKRRPVEEIEGEDLFDHNVVEADVRGHHARLDDVRARGQGNVCGFTDGATFELTGEAPTELHGSYAIHSAIHHAEFEAGAGRKLGGQGAGAYSNRFTCHRFAGGNEAFYTYAPELRPKPRVNGPMTATVVGPAGEEVHTDEHGRIKVRLHWDRGEPQRLGYQPREDHERSCWVRVEQTWAGPGHGAMFLPRVGMEVVISFIGGDPDRPLCTGAVYNGANRPPYALPDNKTRSVLKTVTSPGGGGFNEFSFEDAAGAEEVFLHAQRNLREVVKRSHSTRVGASQTCRVGADQSNTVGGDQENTVEKNQVETVKGDAALAVEGERAQTITGNETATFEADRITKVAGSDTLSVSGPRTETFEAGLTTTIGGGASEVVSSGDKSISLEGGGLAITAPGAITVEQAGAHSLELDHGAKLSTQGDFTITNGQVTVCSEGGSLTLKAAQRLTLGCGLAEIVLDSDGSVQVKGDTRVAVRSGQTSVVAEPSGATVHGLCVRSEAGGVHEIRGALIKIN